MVPSDNGLAHEEDAPPSSVYVVLLNPVGKVSARLTPVAVLGPVFVTVIVYANKFV